MNMKYCFVVCAVILISSPVVKASEYVVFQKETSVTIAPTVLEKSIFFSKKINSLSLLNKVFITTHPGDQKVFGEIVVSVFQKVKRVYTDLWSYLYASIFSIFNW
ncbi:hypothetical protein GCM10023260_08590 [Bartonella acomydis]|uniref:Uncharacterized protein n=1 Tax=Bartonella acomydis TaxID=686234 RepID=A0ABP9MRU6_9HYPH